MNVRGLAKIHHVFRFGDWWQYKIPPLVAVFLFSKLVSAPTGTQQVLTEFCLLFLWMISAASFGYFVNDFSDIEEDNIAGKQNLAQTFHYYNRILIFFVLGIVTLAIQAAINPVTSIPFGLSFLQLVLFVLYSVRPVRLKDKFVLGAICDALYAHLLPAVIVFTSAAKGIEPSTFTNLLALLSAWQLLQGIRNILLHHISDMKNDSKSSSNNLATRFGSDRLHKLSNYVIAPIEVLAAFAFLYLIDARLLTYALITYAVVWLLRLLLSFNGGEKFQAQLNQYNITLWLLNGFYEQVLPAVTIVYWILKSNGSALVAAGALIFYFILFPVFITQFLKGVSVSALGNIKTWFVELWYFRYRIKAVFYDAPKKFIVSSYWKAVTFYWQQYAAYWKRQHEKNPNIRYHFCTVSNSDYLYKVLALHESLKKQSVKARLHVLVTDDGKFDISKFPDTILFYSVQQIAEQPYASAIIDKYSDDKDKMRWCLKPVFMHYLLDKGIADSVLYVDNDIFFFEPFYNLYDYVGNSGVWLTPHWRCMNPFEDGHVFKDSFTDGMFNAGFVGASRAGKNILEWWAMANSFRCEKNRAEGLWDDQKYLDMLPIRFPNVAIVRHMGCNVAVWNKRDCIRTAQGDKVLICGEYPIVFIHFTNDTMSDIEFDKYGGDPLLKPYLEEYKKCTLYFKKMLSE